MDPGDWDVIWWYQNMRYLCSPCVDGLSMGPPGFGASHIGHLQIVLKKFEEHGIIICKSKMQLFQLTIEFL